MAAFGYNNQSKIFPEIAASKFQEQHTVQLNFHRYEDLCPATNFYTKFCEISKQLLLIIIFGGCFWKENREGEGHAETLVD